MATNPIVIVPAAPSGQAIVPTYLTARAGAGTTGYAGAGSVYVRTWNDLSAPGFADMLDDVPASEIMSCDGSWLLGVAFDVTASWPLSITCDVDPTLGDFDVSIEVGYFILTRPAAA